MKRRIIPWQALLIAALIAAAVMGCDELEEQSEDVPAIIYGGDDWDYPYYLVIGGGLSETLSLLTISGPERYAVDNDVQLSCGSINQTLVKDGELFALCSLTHSVLVYDIHDLSISREISVGVGSNPLGMAFYEGNKAFITNYITNNVTYYDLNDDEGQVLATILMPSSDELPSDTGEHKTQARPGGAVMAGDKLFVALSNLDDTYVAGGPGLLAVIDGPSKTLTKTITLKGRDTVGVWSEENGFVYAVSAGDYTNEKGFVGNGLVELIDVESLEIVDSVDIGGAPFDMVVTNEGIAYLGNGLEGVVLSFDTATLEVLDSIDIRDSNDELGLSFTSALAADGNGYLYAVEFNHDRLFVIDTLSGNKIVDRFTVNDGPDTLSFIR